MSVIVLAVYRQVIKGIRRLWFASVGCFLIPLFFEVSSTCKRCILRIFAFVVSKAMVTPHFFPSFAAWTIAAPVLVVNYTSTQFAL